jgi:hypothetical protein
MAGAPDDTPTRKILPPGAVSAGHDGSPGIRRGRRRALLTGYAMPGVVASRMLTVTGYAWSRYRNPQVDRRHGRSVCPPHLRAPHTGDTTILDMGLDSRLDENGNALRPPSTTRRTRATRRTAA